MFGKRFTILKIAGMKIAIDISWFFIAILLSWTLASGFFPERYPRLPPSDYWVMGVLGMLGLFFCVILHELGHALVARHYKLPTSQITLFLFGGVAEITKEPTKAKVEFLMAIAGPIVSFILSAVAYAVAKMGAYFQWPIVAIGIIDYLALINLIIAIFNLLPAFPLDGGRVLRSILWGWKKNLAWATRVSASIGAGFGFLLIFAGILLFIQGAIIGGIWLVILGAFLRHAAASSQTQFFVGKELKGEKAADFMKRDPISAPPDISVQEFVNRYIYKSHHHLYPIVDDGALLGYVSLLEVKALPHDAWASTPIKKIMVPRSQTPTISPSTSAFEALTLLQTSAAGTLFVIEGTKLVGILTTQDLLKLISLKIHLEGR